MQIKIIYCSVSREEAAVCLGGKFSNLGMKPEFSYQPGGQEGVQIDGGPLLDWKKGEELIGLFANDQVVQFVALHPEAKLPSRGSKQAAGLDLYSIESKWVEKDSTVLIRTGLALERLPDGAYARIAPRSGLGLKGLFVNAGVVDADYRGEIGVVLYNAGPVRFEVTPGMRIAQLIVERYVPAEPVLVGKLSQSDRDSGGFGSTGLK